MSISSTTSLTSSLTDTVSFSSSSSSSSSFSSSSIRMHGVLGVSADAVLYDEWRMSRGMKPIASSSSAAAAATANMKAKREMNMQSKRVVMTTTRLPDYPILSADHFRINDNDNDNDNEKEEERHLHSSSAHSSPFSRALD